MISFPPSLHFRTAAPRLLFSGKAGPLLLPGAGDQLLPAATSRRQILHAGSGGQSTASTSRLSGRSPWGHRATPAPSWRRKPSERPQDWGLAPRRHRVMPAWVPGGSIPPGPLSFFLGSSPANPQPKDSYGHASRFLHRERQRNRVDWIDCPGWISKQQGSTPDQHHGLRLCLRQRQGGSVFWGVVRSAGRAAGIQKRFHRVPEYGQPEACGSRWPLGTSFHTRVSISWIIRRRAPINLDFGLATGETRRLTSWGYGVKPAHHGRVRGGAVQFGSPYQKRGVHATPTPVRQSIFILGPKAPLSKLAAMRGLLHRSAAPYSRSGPQVPARQPLIPLYPNHEGQG